MKRASLTRNATVHKGRPVIKRNRIGIYLLRTLGAALAAFAISVFFTPNKIVNGGVSGVATMIHYTTGLSTGLSFAIINFTLLAIGLRILGKDFVLRTVYVSGILSVFVELFSYIPTPQIDIILASIFGAVIYGVGLGYGRTKLAKSHWFFLTRMRKTAMINKIVYYLKNTMQKGLIHADQTRNQIARAEQESAA